MIKTDTTILEFIKDTVSDKGNVTIDNLRMGLNIGYRRSKRMLEFLVSEGQLERVRGKGFVATPKFIPEVTEKEVEDYNGNREKVLDENWVSRTVQQNQSLRDNNNRLNRILRETNRESNKIDAIIESVRNNIEIINNDDAIFPESMEPIDKIAIVQLSDLHFNETVEPEHVKGSNEYNWDVASKRLKKYANEVKRFLEYEGIDHIIVALTGDLFNSSRRYDEVVANSDSQAVALLTGCDLITKFILDVSNFGALKERRVNVYSVFGNESRMKNDYTSLHWEDSFDYLLHQFVSVKLSGFQNIYFEEPTLDHSLVLRDVLGANILLIHGHNRTTFQKELEKYATNPDLKKRVVIDYLLYGHIHTTKIDEKSRRSSSLVGNNAYSYHQLGIQGSAEQNFHILKKECENRVPILQTITVNLDYTGNLEGYHIQRDKFYRKDDPKIVNFGVL